EAPERRGVHRGFLERREPALRADADGAEVPPAGSRLVLPAVGLRHRAAVVHARVRAEAAGRRWRARERYRETGEHVEGFLHGAAGGVQLRRQSGRADDRTRPGPEHTLRAQASGDAEEGGAGSGELGAVREDGDEGEVKAVEASWYPGASSSAVEGPLRAVRGGYLVHRATYRRRA